MTDISKLFSGILKQEKKIKSLEGSKDYWKEREVLVESLRSFLREDFTKLPKEKFLKLCDMASTYRPVQPFSFLVSVSMRKK